MNAPWSSGLRPYQSCRTNEGWFPVLIPSESQPGRDYTVLVCPWKHHRENICECPGYFYNGNCKHQLTAELQLCRWDERTSNEKQTDEQRKHKICPKCGGPTVWQLEEVIHEDDGS